MDGGTAEGIHRHAPIKERRTTRKRKRQVSAYREVSMVPWPMPTSRRLTPEH